MLRNEIVPGALARVPFPLPENVLLVTAAEPILSIPIELLEKVELMTVKILLG